MKFQGLCFPSLFYLAFFIIIFIGSFVAFSYLFFFFLMCYQYENFVPHRLDTRFGGFYINTGSLEFKPAEDLVDGYVDRVCVCGWVGG